MGPTRKSDAKHQAILDAAETAFGADGYAATTIDRIATLAGISKGSVYNYFSSKQELFMELFTRLLAGDEAQADVLIGRPLSAAQKLEAFIDMWFEKFEHYQKVGGLFLEFWATAAREQREGGLAETLQEMATGWRGRVAGIIAQGVDSGEFRGDLDCQWAAMAILAMLDGLTVQAIVRTIAGVDEDFVAALKRGVVASLLPGVDSPASTQEHDGGTV